MKKVILIFSAASLVLVTMAGSAYAQAGGGQSAPRQLTAEQRQQMQQRREEMLQQRQEQLKQRREDLKQQREQMMAQRKEMMEQFRDVQRQLRDQIKSGQLTRDQAKEQLHAWRSEHKPTKPERPAPPSGK